MDQQLRVCVIGAGVMGEALIAALIEYGVKPEQITVSEKRLDRTQELIELYGIKAAPLEANVANADVILLVVKPQEMEAVLTQAKDFLTPSAFLITFAAGKKIAFISEILGTDNPIIRVMPNTPALVGKGMAAISIGKGVSEFQKDFVLGFLNATGKVIEVEEALQNAVTATSGSGPAYIFAFAEAMISGAMELGLNQDDATTLTIQTIVGAAKLLDESGKSATTLRENVTSPNGTTAAALSTFENNNLNAIVSAAMKAACDRSQELA